MLVNMSKCVAVQLWREFCADAKSEVQTSLVHWAPTWSTIAIQAFTTFLGFAFGPGASTSEVWRDPIAKYLLRARTIIASAPPPSVGAVLLRSRADSVLQYLAQYVEPPEALRMIEMLTPGRLLHMPGKPFSRAMIAHAPSFLSLKLVSQQPIVGQL